MARHKTLLFYYFYSGPVACDNFSTKEELQSEQMSCSTPYNSIASYAPLSGPRSADVLPNPFSKRSNNNYDAPYELVQSEKSVKGSKKMSSASCCLHGGKCDVARNGRENTRPSVADSVDVPEPDRVHVQRPHSENRPPHARNERSSEKKREKRGRDKKSGREKRHPAEAIEDRQYENINLQGEQRECPKDVFQVRDVDPFSADPNAPPGASDSHGRAVIYTDSEVMQVPRAKNVVPRCLQYKMETPTKNMANPSAPGGISHACYAGVRAVLEAEGLLSRHKKAVFLMYHQSATTLSLKELASELKLHVCYKTLDGNFRHHRIRQRGGKQGLEYFVDYGDRSAPSFVSLDELADYYLARGTIPRSKLAAGNQ